ncbi:DNA glycosylase AlkZ-like family protein [Nocardia sp. NPDC058666]|uniref:DNA glycosylase AlkZ-like family protein n=1 Tax=Nocardia sp. NPDC058666 TaxID=3346587 RepID=UPI00366A2F10
MDVAGARALIAEGESLTTEFKRGAEGKFNDTDLVNTVVCMANGNGGVILIGVEDDGTVTGAAPRHGKLTDPRRLDALIAAKTIPLVQTRTDVVRIDELDVICVEIPATRNIVGSTAGVYLRRTLKLDGTPQCLPFAAHEMLAHEIDRGALDFAAVAARGAQFSDLDPAEFDRFRRLAGDSAADRVVPQLTDRDICRALQVLRNGDDGREHLTLGAILLFGTSQALARYVPNHEAAFQQFHGQGITVNDFTREPLLRTAEELYDRVRRWNTEEEFEAGMLRIAVPNVAPTVARESIANALVHRDYTAVGPIRVMVNDEAFSVDSPGSFPPGVRLDNLLTASHPRSPILADAFRRAGLVERSGRGISLMYLATLRLGRGNPDYSQSTEQSVRVVVPLGRADLPLARFILARDTDTGQPLNLFELQVLHELRVESNLSTSEIADRLDRTLGVTRAGLSRMIELGLLELRGNGRNRTYHLSASVYRAINEPSAYVRVRGADAIQQEQMIIQFIGAYGPISRADTAELCLLTPNQAGALLRRMVREGKLEIIGERRTARYVLATGDDNALPSSTG